MRQKWLPIELCGSTWTKRDDIFDLFLKIEINIENNGFGARCEVQCKQVVSFMAFFVSYFVHSFVVLFALSVRSAVDETTLSVAVNNFWNFLFRSHTHTHTHIGSNHYPNNVVFVFSTNQNMLLNATEWNVMLPSFNVSNVDVFPFRIFHRQAAIETENLFKCFIISLLRFSIISVV